MRALRGWRIPIGGESTTREVVTHVEQLPAEFDDSDLRNAIEALRGGLDALDARVTWLEENGVSKDLLQEILQGIDDRFQQVVHKRVENLPLTDEVLDRLGALEDYVAANDDFKGALGTVLTEMKLRLDNSDAADEHHNTSIKLINNVLAEVRASLEEDEAA
jgi:hypothetical protein